ncbi:MAG: permease [Planctomycetota bacterium]
MPEWLGEFSMRAASVVVEAIPFVIVGAFVSALLEVHLPDGLLRRIIPAGPLGLLAGALAGLVMPLCECGIVPVLRRLVRKGVPTGPAVAYLFAGPIVNPIVFASTTLAFGPQGLRMAVARTVIGLLAAILLGALAGRIAPAAGDLLAETGGGHGSEDHGEHKKGVVAIAISELVEILSYLALGAVLAAAINVLVRPHDAFAAVAGTPALSIPVFMSLAYGLSVCSEADAFIAASFTGTSAAASFAGTPAAALLAFLTLGPMLDVKLTLIYAKVLRRRAALILLPAVVVVIFLLNLAAHASGLLPALGGR